MNTKTLYGFYYTLFQRLKQNVFLFYFLQPALMVIAGYSLVASPLPVLLKSAMFGLIAFFSGWLVYRFMMVSKRQNSTAL